MIKKPVLFIRAFFFAAILFSSVSGNEPKYGGTVMATITADPGGLNPAITTQGGVTTISGSIFSGLVAADFDLNPVPDLAESWEISDSGRKYTFHLAKNAMFHDGVPLTSADVKFTFEEMLLKYHSRTRAAIGGNLKSISTPDAHTVVFEFEKPYAAFLQLADVTNAPVLPKHIYEPHSGAAYKASLKGMYEWSAKSNVYFAQDAYWTDGEGADQTASAAFGQRRFYFLLIVGSIALIAVIAVFWKRRKQA